MIGGFCDSIVTIENQLFVPELARISLKINDMCVVLNTPFSADFRLIIIWD
jgi:hypothetical protein